jgi:hypothetical protein
VITTFDSYEAFADALASRLPIADEQLRQAVITGIATGDAAARRRPASGEAELELRVGPWFLRDDDTPYFESAGVIASLTTALVTGAAIPPAGVVAAAITVAAGTWKVWRKGGRLDRDEMAVLTALEQSGPLSEEELQRIVGTDVGAALGALADVELRDGSSARLVKRLGDGRWRSLGV